MPQAKLDKQQAGGLERDRPQIEQIRRARSAGGRVREHRIGRVESREQDEVGEQEDPEAVGGDDALRRGALLAAVVVARCRACADRASASRCIGTRCDARLAALDERERGPARRSRVDPRDLVGRQLVFGMVAPGEDDEGREGADEPDRSTIHQMCQISAKPVTTAKKATTKPVGLLRGISIGL